MRRAGVVDHEVHDQLHPALVQPGDQLVELLERAEQRVDVLVVADVVAVVGHRRPVDRAQPDDVDAEPLEVVEVVDDAAEVADAVAVAVGEAARVDLVDDGGLPPVTCGHGRQSCGSVEQRPHGRPGQQEHHDQQRDGDEAAQAHPVTEDEVDQRQHDELAADRDHPQEQRDPGLGPPAVGGLQPHDDPALEEDHHFQGDLEEHGRQQGQREAFADDRRDVLDREVEDDHVDEDVDDVGGARTHRRSDHASSLAERQPSRERGTLTEEGP